MSHDCLQSSPDAGVQPDLHSCADGAAGPDAPAGLPALTDEAKPATTGSVLVLEDDKDLREAIRDFLAESGYAVVEVPSGVEGIREVMAGDFALVLCDIKMPGLPGDMFYRAVERVRPALCERFIFMSGHADNPKASGFLDSIHAYVLHKPFQFKDLSNAIALAEVRRSFRTVLEGDALREDDHEATHTLLVGQHFPTPPPPAPPKMREAAATGDAAPAPEPSPPAARPAKRGNLAPRLLAGAGFSLIILLGAILGSRNEQAQRAATAAAAELRAAEPEWKTVSAQRDQAERARRRLAALPKQAKRLADERAAGGWAAALRSIVTSAGPQIDLQGITARAVEAPAGACEFVIDGTAAGVHARARADEFRRALHRELEQRFPGTVATAFDRLDDHPEAATETGPAPATFIISVKIGAGPPATAQSQGPQ